LIPLAAGATWFIHRIPLWIVVRRLFIIAVFAFIILIPVIVRNYQIFHAFVPISTNGGINFLIGNNAEATGYYKMPSNIHLSGNEVEQSRQAYILGFQWIRSHPIDALWGVVKKAFHLLHRNDSGILFSSVKTTGSLPWLVVVCAIIFENGIYYIMGILSMIYIVRRRLILRMNEYFLIFVWCSMTIFYLVYFGSHRFHIPYTLLLMGFTASWICEGFEKEHVLEGAEE
jgi:hypothetical protein